MAVITIAHLLSQNLSFENFSTSADRVKFSLPASALVLLPPFHETVVVGRKQLLHSTGRSMGAKVDGRHLGVKAASREGIEGGRLPI